VTWPSDAGSPSLARDRRRSPRHSRLLAHPAGSSALRSIFSIWGGDRAANAPPAATLSSAGVTHGLHVLGGFYHNCFSQLRNVYSEWTEAQPQGAIPFFAAFTPVDRFSLLQRDAAGWRQVRVNMPRRAGEPGAEAVNCAASSLLTELLDLLSKALRRIATGEGVSDIFPGQIEDSGQLRPRPEYEADAAWLKAASDLAGKPGSAHDAFVSDQLQAGLDSIRERVDKDPVLSGADWIGVLLYGLTVARGFISDRVSERGFDAIDQEEAEAWLRRHGAPDRALRCALFRAGYHYAFAFVDGDPLRPDIAAGAGLRALCRMIFGYRGSVFQHMRGGMGEIYVMPFYDVLRDKGVRFHPFRRVDAIHPGAVGRIGAVEISVQAHLAPGRTFYDAAVERQLPDGAVRRVFLTRPDYAQLASGTEESDHYESMVHTPIVGRRTLYADTDFDLCVLALPPGALHTVTPALAEASEKWRAMLDGAASSPTIAAQIWHKRSAKGPGFAADSLYTAYELPLDTWSDMEFLLPDEDAAPSGTRPVGLSYLCGPVEGSTGGEDEQVRADRILTRWLAAHGGRAFPHLSSGGTYDQQGELERFSRINSDQSSLYSLHRAGTVRTRMRATTSGYANLYLAGDWTRHNFDMGALEPAVMSAMTCARAITSHAVSIVGESDFA
jgi:uncharacterized protein with NAD-binding domain and iron-sulfur cluster